MAEPANPVEAAAATEMMSTIERARSRCFRAFEVGRLWRATRTIAWTTPLAVLAWISHPEPQMFLLWTPGALLAFVFTYIGMGWQETLRPSLASGLVLATLPTVLAHRRPCLSTSESCAFAWFLASVVAAGVLALAGNGPAASALPSSPPCLFWLSERSRR